MRVYVVRKWPLRGTSRFVCWIIIGVSLWLLCNVQFVQSTERTRLQTRQFVRGINCLLKLGVCASINQMVIAAVQNIVVPMLTRVWQELEYRVDVHRVTGGAHIEHL
jgi:hypothetical protein